MTYRFRVLGDFKARRLGSPELGDVTKHELLLAILLAADGQSVNTKTLYAWCWQPDEHPDEWWDNEEERKKALNKLDVALTILRKAYVDHAEGVALSRRTPSGFPESSSCTLTVPAPSAEVQGPDPDPSVFLLDAHFLSACITRARDSRDEPFALLQKAFAVWAPPFNNLVVEEGKIPILAEYRSNLRQQLESAASDLLEPALPRGKAAEIARVLRTYYAGVESEEIPMIYARALYALGRHVDADTALSEAYTAIRARTGLSPSAAFQKLLKQVRDKSLPPEVATTAEPKPSIPGPAVAPTARKSSWLADYLAYVNESYRTIPLQDFLADLLRHPNSETSYAPLLTEPRLGEVRAQGQPIPLTEAVETTRTTALVGDSGAGKSTFLRWHAHQVASASQSAGPEGRVPVIVDLARFNELVVPRFPSPDYLTDQIRLSLEEIGFSVESAELAAMAAGGRLELLLDALNEIVDGDTRQAVGDLISRYARRYPECRLVLTTTPSVARTTLPSGFVPVTVYGFGEPQMKLFLEQLAPPLGRSSEDAVSLLNEIAHSPELELFARTPLYLTAIATRFFEDGHLPRTRAAALASAVDWQLKRRRRALQPFMAPGEAVDSAFEVVALEMLRSGGAARKRIGRGHLVSVLTRRGLCVDPADAEGFVEGASAGGGPLIPTGRRGDFTFHDAFRDYLGARCFARMEADNEDPSWWDEVESHLDDPTWEQPIRFLASCLLDAGWEAVTTLLDRVAAASRALPMPDRVRRVARTLPTLQDLLDAGYDLAEAHQFTDLIRTIAELHFRPHPEIPLRDRVDACTVIGVMGDNRLTNEQATIAWLEKTDVTVGCQEDEQVAEWELGPEVVSFPLFGFRRFLVTVSEFERFVDADGYGNDDLWEPKHRAWRTALGHVAPLDWEIQRLTPNRPVTGVSWYEVTAYCTWLSRSRSDGWVVRLPTEREWEYAARYRSSRGQPFPWGNLEPGDRAQANWAGTHLRHKTPVGMFPPSTTLDGLADLYGNVEEWCDDEWDRTEDEVLAQRFVALASIVNPDPPPARVVRGGSCIRYARLCRPGYRSRILEGGRYHTVGFRWVLVAPDHRTSA